MLQTAYKYRYENIIVPTKHRGSQIVSVDSYRLRSLTRGDGAYNQDAKNKFFAKLNENHIDPKGHRNPLEYRLKIDTPLRVDADDGVIFLDPEMDDVEEEGPGPGRTDTSVGGDLPYYAKPPGPNDLQEPPNDLHSMAAYVFAGKGSPEHCQIVLQLANQWGLAPNPQQYADDALGLDCNGFVGNYLWHEKKEKDWTDLGLRFRDLGPDALIDAFFPINNQGFVARWEDLDGAKTYLMGQADGNGRIIPGAGAVGHITITQPGRVRLDRTNPRTKVTSKAIYVVESCGFDGLSESYYSLYSAAGANRVFTVWRESLTVKTLDVKIAELK